MTLPRTSNSHTFVGNTVTSTNSANSVIIHTGTTSGSRTIRLNTNNSAAYVTASNSGVWVNEIDIISQLRKGIDIGDNRIVSLTVDDELIVTQCHDDFSSSRIPVQHYHSGVVKLDPNHQHFLPGMVFKTPDGSALKLNKDGSFDRDVMRNARKKVINVKGGSSTLYESLAFCHFKDIHIPSGHRSEAVFTLPNGVQIKLHLDDSIEIDESNGTQLYKSSPTRNFNKYLNASDLLEDFVQYCAEEKMSRKDFSEIPISLFIYWLIVKAAEADGDDTSDVLPLLTTTVNNTKNHRHRCRCCGKFLSKRHLENQIHFCSTDHMQRHMDKVGL